MIVVGVIVVTKRTEVEMSFGEKLFNVAVQSIFCVVWLIFLFILTGVLFNVIQWVLTGSVINLEGLCNGVE